MLYACGDKQSYSVINTNFSFPDRRFAHNGILSHSFSLGFELSEKLTAVNYIYGIKYIEGFLFLFGVPTCRNGDLQGKAVNLLQWDSQ